MALLLWAISSIPNQICILHFDHNTRSGASTQDAEWLKKVAKAIEVPLFSEKAIWDCNKKKSEANLRGKRWHFFEKILYAQKINYLLQGHHADDVAETLLMRLSRGVSSDELTTLLPKRKWNQDITIIRPFFKISKKTIIEGMNLLGKSLWREDKSNQSNYYYRNFIRNKILKPWEDYSNRSLSQPFLQTHALIHEDAMALDNYADQVLLASQNSYGNLSLSILLSEPKAIVRRVLQKWLKKSTNITELAKEHFDRWWGYWNDGRGDWTWNLKETFTLRSHNRILSIRSNCKKHDPPYFYFCGYPVGEVFFHQNSIQFELINLSPRKRADILSGKVAKNEACRDLNNLSSGSRIIRNWLPGDSYRPMNAPGCRKLQDWFVDRKIALEKRKKLPLVFSKEGHLLWCPLFPPAHIFALNKESKKALRLTYLDRGTNLLFKR